MDMLHLGFEDHSFDVVLDKAAMDALLVYIPHSQIIVHTCAVSIV